MRRPSLVALLFAAACAGGTDDPLTSAAGLRTVFDSSRADSVVARTSGEVPATAIRTLVEELRIAPAADDTSLFGEVDEFDVGRDGRLYVFDRAANVLMLFDSTGALERRVGRQGAGPGEFNANNGMVVLPDGRLAQWDARNARISFFGAAGDFLNQWVLPAGFSTSNGLRTDSSGTVHIYRPVTPPREGEILGRFGLVRLGENGVWRDSLIPPDLPVERIVYVARVKDNTSATSPLHSARFLWQWHPDGHFLSVNSARYAIEASRPGRPLRIERDAPVVPVSAEERAYEQERMTRNLRNTDPGWVFKGPPIPGSKAPVSALSVARDGRIWVRVATPSQLIPEAERESDRPERLAPRYRDPVVYEVFERDGRFLGRVRFPMQSTWMEGDGDRVWFLQRDADGLPAVVRARVSVPLR